MGRPNPSVHERRTLENPSNSLAAILM